MGVYPLGTMDDSKRDNVNKMKRSRNDQVTQAALTYLQKRNYPATNPSEISPEQMDLEMLVDSEVSRPNSITYSCYNSDPAIIDHSYIKFSSWVKEVNKSKNCDDLHHITGPLFCHLYLELSQRGHTEKATNFLKSHLSTIDTSKCDENVINLINIFTNDAPDVNGAKKTFRSNKYVISLSATSVRSLKKFLAESCHTVMLQILQTWFQICEAESTETNEECIAKHVINGHCDDTPVTSSILLKLQDTITQLKKENKPLYTVALNNVKDDVSCGLINCESGLAIYSYNSSIFLRSLRTLRQLDGTDEVEDVVLREHSSSIYDMSYMPIINCLVSASRDKTLRLFNLKNFTQERVYKGHNYPVYCVTTSKNGQYIISGSYDHTARLWSIENSNTLRVYVGHTQEVTSIDFHSNALYFCTGSADKNIRMWSINDGNPVRLFLGSKGIIYCVAYSNNGRYLASAGDDKRIRIWDLIAGKQLLEIKVASEPIVQIAWSTDDSVLCIGTVDGVIRTWDINNIINNVDPNHSSTLNISLNAKLLSLEYSYDTFACLTANSASSRYVTMKL